MSTPIAGVGTESAAIQQTSLVGATPEVALSSVSALRNELNIQFQSVNTRFDAMDKAATILHEDNARVPTQIDRSVSSIRELVFAKLDDLKHKTEKLEEILSDRPKFVSESLNGIREYLEMYLHKEVASLDGRVNVVTATAEEQLKSVQMQFLLLKQATEQLDVANKTAIAAALQAQKESAGETQKTSQAAIAKSEASTSEAIKALRSTFDIAVTSLSDRFLDLKSRIDRGEGKAAVVDPGIMQLAEQVRDLARSRDSNSGMGYMVVTGVAIIVSLVMAGIAVFGLIRPSGASAPGQVNYSAGARNQDEIITKMIEQNTDMIKQLQQRMNALPR